MSRKLNFHKRHLSRYCNLLDNLITQCEDEGLESFTNRPDNDRLTQWRSTIAQIEGYIDKISEQQEEYIKTIDNIPQCSQKEDENFDEYLDRAVTIKDRADHYVRLLKSHDFVQELQNNLTKSEQTYVKNEIKPTVKQLELPTVSIPKFNGDIWEWDNFWEMFNTNVHSQDLSELQKFNLLILSLGEKPRSAIKHFRLSKENYRKAIELLTNKYGDPEELTLQLHDKLDRTSLRSPAIHEQRTLLEDIQTIMGQLTWNGENVDNHCMYRKVLSKFPDHIQDKVPDKKTSTSDRPFNMQQLLLFLEKVISSEEKKARYTTNDSQFPNNEMGVDSRVGHSKSQTTLVSCMYCRGIHKSIHCTTYKTPQDRYEYLRNNKLCLICASPHHSAYQCKKSSCYKCQKRHHTSSCLQSITKEGTFTCSSIRGRNHSNNDTKKGRPSAMVTKKSMPTSNVNFLAQDQTSPSPEESVILNVRSAKHHRGEKTTLLPIGEVTVMDATSGSLKKVSVLLDTGAETSFIETALATELNLPTMEKSKLRLHMFGSDKAQETLSNKVLLKAWDAEGLPISLLLFTQDILTRPITTPTISEEDTNFIQQRQLPVDLSRNKRQVKPSILLGSDQLWSLVKNDQPPIELPSGLHLLPTRLGHLVTGRVSDPPILENQNDRLDKLGDHFSLDGQVEGVSIGQFELDDEDSNNWEKYYTLESAGTEEFSNSEKEVKAMMDHKVWEQFTQTIEKRSDGYYVRLPWKEVTTTLPDNKAIALSRLASVWKSLQSNEDLLDKYNEVFAEQIRLQILEEISEERTQQGSRVHYLPHQAVLSPNKNTKLRVVYDASAHYKGCPSLNECLHRGPVILPQLLGILLRFRFGRIAITSDVEKAFLQVRLHEDDRDATRCLWLHDHKSPPSPNNIKILRFTRVTFGLITSPFLLAATIHFHLEQYQEDPQLVSELKDNLYVDNLVLTVDELEEALQVYSVAKRIFNDLSMNLRAFASNSTNLMLKMATVDRSESRNTNVLGIPWDLAYDSIHLTCNPKPHSQITKRTIASTIASIYDPLGMLLPLLHKARLFLRDLWKEKYDWDKPLPQSRENEWTHIYAEIHGFKKTLPRCLGAKNTKYTLVTFADASNDAIATCVYLRSEHSVNLLIAKAKMASIKSKATIPKLELDAVTLSLRVTNTVVSQLRRIIDIKDIFIFSDSEIVLTWIKHRPLGKVGTRVFNRLVEIAKIEHYLEENGQRLYYCHIASQYNPADCATRGLNKEELQNHFWWRGPQVLSEQPDIWKQTCNSFHANQESTPDIMKLHYNENLETQSIQSYQEAQAFLIRDNQSDNNEIFSILQKHCLPNIKRIIVWILRYIRISVDRVNRRVKPQIKLSMLMERINVNYDPNISGEEIAVASKILIKEHQLSLITPPILQCMKHLNINTDNEGLLRCFGRLGHSELDVGTKNPLLVLQNSWLAQAIITECHKKGHPGTGHTMAIVREQFWIPKLRAQVTRILRRCMQCQKFNNLPYKYPEHSDLPEERVQRSRPFERVGLDYFGPLSVRKSDGTEDKCYGCIITCMATRLLHLDIVSDLSTTAFLMMLRRFFARRGTPKSITSDNAPTFLLGETILKEGIKALQRNPAVEREISDREIRWKHITPFAPWQGGFYERLIKSVKQSLFKTIGTTKLTFEHLSTIVTEIEALLNTRPLLYMESQKEKTLRPIDFIQNEFEVFYPFDTYEDDCNDASYLPVEEQSLLKTKNQAIKALQSSCKFTERFWEIWRTQYLTSLREKHRHGLSKNKGAKRSPRKDDVVLINDPVQPRYLWKMGRIEHLVANSQGVVREAVILLPSRRKIRRPINLLIPLELEDNHLLQDTETKETPRPINSDTNVEDPATNNDTEDSTTLSRRYNLRPRKDRST